MKSKSKPNIFAPALPVQPNHLLFQFQQAAQLHQAGQLQQAKTLCERILSVQPKFIHALHLLGMIALQIGDAPGAVKTLAGAVRLAPDDFALQCNYGNALAAQQNFDSAIAAYDHALKLNPRFADAYYSRGIAKSKLNRFDEAFSDFSAVTSIVPRHAAAISGQEVALRGQAYGLEKAVLPEQALILYMKALCILETPEAKVGFSRCAKKVIVTGANEMFRGFLLRAIREAWTRPAELFAPAIQVIRLNSEINACFVRAEHGGLAPLSLGELFDEQGLLALMSEPLLLAVLECMQIKGMENERFFTQARGILLDAAFDAQGRLRNDDSTADVHKHAMTLLLCAIAKQCFINEYVFATSAGELQKVAAVEAELLRRLGASVPLSGYLVAALGAYRPLNSLVDAYSLIKMEWEQPIQDLITLQIVEPATERALRPSVVRLTPIDDCTSQAVQEQYEENPYPRWLKTASAIQPTPIDIYLKQCFPYSPISKENHVGTTEILIAGCGTGQQSIEAAQLYQGVEVLAIDLSVSSLCYARRKTKELGLTNIQYGHADILKLPSLGRTFDVIESVGVLHHMADPFTAWKGLVGILRPRGFMRLGFYSELGRRSVVTTRRYIQEKGYTPTADSIRRCRQDILSAGSSDVFGNVTTFRDFFGLSECRDLLFHVQERRYTIPELADALSLLGLQLIGFSVDDAVSKQYHDRYPDDKSGTNLDNWHAFETEYPDTFAGMYQFWTQKI
ncbi:MAG: tetratricopeptide repeat protein [Rhodoferax sp.]|nr:tetratricopeptide repeat protein [Rhodoferax sp.]